MSSGEQEQLIRTMQQPSFYDHPVAQVELIETHISWVFLAGEFAYKLKKPVNFGFLDFSTLAKRQHYCREEVRLNRRFAPQLYLDVKTIGGDRCAPVLDAEPPLEYAVKMKRFDQQAQLDRMLAAGLLGSEQVAAFARYIAQCQQRATVAGAEVSFGLARMVIAPTEENFAQIEPRLLAAERQQLAAVKTWSRRTAGKLTPLFEQRKANGFIRECHGDLHLANMAWIDGQPILFDGIEFNENLRWIDVISDVAFLVMDLDDRQEFLLSWHFLNRYLQETGDYQGLLLLKFYQVYRAMVRAKVTCLRLSQTGLSATERAAELALYHSYLDLASSYTTDPTRALIITHGLSGSGKSTFIRKLADDYGAIHLQSDRERKRLHGLAATAKSHSTLTGGIYTDQAHAATYEQLQQLAETVLTAGFSVIVDATFLKKAQRNPFHQLAEKLQVPLTILDFSVTEAELRRRIQQRVGKGIDASEATLEVLDYQLTEQQPLARNEQRLALRVGPATTAAEITALLKVQIKSHRPPKDET